MGHKINADIDVLDIKSCVCDGKLIKATKIQIEKF